MWTLTQSIWQYIGASLAPTVDQGWVTIKHPIFLTSILLSVKIIKKIYLNYMKERLRSQRHVYWNTFTQHTQTEFTRSYRSFALLVVPSLALSLKSFAGRHQQPQDRKWASLTITSNNSNASVFTSAWPVVVGTFWSTEPGFLHEAWSPFVLDAMSFLTCRSLVPVTSSILWISDIQSLEL